MAVRMAVRMTARMTTRPAILRLPQNGGRFFAFVCPCECWVGFGMGQGRFLFAAPLPQQGLDPVNLVIDRVLKPLSLNKRQFVTRLEILSLLVPHLSDEGKKFFCFHALFGWLMMLSSHGAALICVTYRLSFVHQRPLMQLRPLAQSRHANGTCSCFMPHPCLFLPLVLSERYRIGPIALILLLTLYTLTLPLFGGGDV